MRFFHIHSVSLFRDIIIDYLDIIIRFHSENDTLAKMKIMIFPKMNKISKKMEMNKSILTGKNPFTFFL